MFPPTDYLGVKICGFKQPAQVQAVLDLGADAVGINLWPSSKRYLPLEQAQAELSQIAAQHHLIAVMVNASHAEQQAAVRSGLFRSLQLHGDESPEQVAELQAQGVHVIKALQVRDAASLDEIGHYPCEDILLDAYNPGLYGGGGHAFPWELASQAAERYPEKRLILSGGLTVPNIAEAIRQTHPCAVDVASGVESSPGIKDLALVEEFIRRVRGGL
jgi:phosphoribosylanthranilate isomerase